MTTLLAVHASARSAGSHSRRLTDAFLRRWRAQRPGDRVIQRDLAKAPPPPVTENWIRAAFTPAGERSEALREVLAPSDRLIAELEAAELLVIGTPMYNYGPPSPLKAWIDQVIRVNATFRFDPARGDWPLEPILGGKTLVLLTSHGEFGFAPGGVRAHMDHLASHLRTCAPLLGVERTHHVAIEYQEFGDTRHRRSVEAAHAEVDALARELTARADAPPPPSRGAIEAPAGRV